MNVLPGQYCNTRAGRGARGQPPHGSQEGSPGSVPLAGTQGERVKEVLFQAGGRGPQLLQLADTGAQVVDELHILAQEVPSQEGAQVGVVLAGGQLAQIAHALRHHPRHLQGALHGAQAALPLAVVGHPDISQADAPPSLVLQPHQGLGVLPLLPRPPQEEGGEVRQGLVLAVEVEGHGQVRVGGMQLQVDLVVERGLAVVMVILAHLGHGPGHHHRRRGGHGWRRRGQGREHGQHGQQVLRGRPSRQEGHQSLSARGEGRAAGWAAARARAVASPGADHPHGAGGGQPEAESPEVAVGTSKRPSGTLPAWPETRSQV